MEALLPSTPPAYVRAIFENGFRNPFGVIALAGLFGLPFSVYLSLSLHPQSGSDMPHGVAPLLHSGFSIFASRISVAALAVARLFAASAEAWIVGRHVSRLILEDALERQPEEQLRNK